MARIVLADDGIEFDGRTPEERPLGGTESSVAALAGELAARGHDVQVMNKCQAPLDHRGVAWRPIDGGDWPESADLYIANRGDIRRVFGVLMEFSAEGVRISWNQFHPKGCSIDRINRHFGVEITDQWSQIDIRIARL